MLLGNLAVLAGIIFLVVEIDQNTNMMRSQTKNAMTENQMSFYALVIENPDMAALLFKGRGTTDTSMYTEEEFNRLSYLFNSQLRMWENEWYQYQIGLFDEEEFVPRMQNWENIFQNEGYRGIWGTVRSYHSEGFREIIDGFIIEN